MVDLTESVLRELRWVREPHEARPKRPSQRQPAERHGVKAAGAARLDRFFNAQIACPLRA